MYQLEVGADERDFILNVVGGGSSNLLNVRVSGWFYFSFHLLNGGLRVAFFMPCGGS